MPHALISKATSTFLELHIHFKYHELDEGKTLSSQLTSVVLSYALICFNEQPSFHCIIGGMALKGYDLLEVCRLFI